MSRVTPPVTKLTRALRGISSSATAARPSGLLDAQSRASRHLPRNIEDLRAECKKRSLNVVGNKNELVDRLTAHDIVGARSFNTGILHRPTPSPLRTIPLMQGFKTSAPKLDAHNTSTIDCFFFPALEPAPQTDSFHEIRVPLLPDNYTPDRSALSGHTLEAFDGALPRPEISIVAAHPENVAPAAMSEVVGNEALDVDIEQLTTSAFTKPMPRMNKEPGALGEIWDGFMDDILGPKNPSAAF
ncbi:uncharacterized protein L3040_001317 [Drepanopeziza brunnea f. sp. 'multigermtubi']|uniref:SAP domain-containing protein n=1 Tax=Marssonina brunnea f. sp. multigermtubi (strain MB_m1) TaxID=1072389 RepID=K1WGB3_MARBU|nr:uncharacterized protein MBM_05044 [Drepanopeziza brunnea f. sp. 'multigermtubi' MB_m1]EKD16575.1 hypothetical protein MBM_05044 [Drepanopeziza brunnea f. sp. 'multigermtubi' MB_m1]KAJ5051541.1 hypothetical protein L3040_001317 [Drepanopeziza brunnea f. sp. 'multigermtubi']